MKGALRNRPCSMSSASAPTLETLDRAALAEVIAAHLRFVQRKPGGRRAVLNHVDLQNCDLEGVRLNEAELTGCVFNGASMARANLEMAVLAGCDMRDVD